MNNNKNIVSKSICLLLFLIGATSFYDLNLLGRIPISEILAISCLPFILPKVYQKDELLRLRNIGGIFILWIGGVILSDLVNEVPYQYFLRGVAKPIFCLFWMLFFICIIKRDFRVLLWYPIGVVVASIQNYYFPQEYTSEKMLSESYELVAYGYLPMVNAVCIAGATWIYRRSRFASIILFFGCGILLFLISAPRSAASIMLLNSVIVAFIFARFQGQKFIIRPRFSHVAILSILLVLFAGVSYQFYLIIASKGILGETQRLKLLEQERTIFGDSPLGLFLAGRTPVYAAILAIRDNPVLGYGSWSGMLLTEYYVDAIISVGTDAAILEKMGKHGLVERPGHSILFGAWMENGLLAALGLLLIGFLIARETTKFILYDNPLAPWLIALGTSFAWSFFFSPFGVSSRMIIGLFMAVYITRSAEINRSIRVKV